jgi:uncharacterized protein YutE (UPF0331/DUF86 family)
MSNVTYDIHRQKIDEIAREYESHGYQVVVEPDAEQMPEFLGRFQPDILARTPNDSVVVEVKIGTQTAVSDRYRDLADAIRRHPGWRFSLVVVDPRSDEVTPATQRLLDQKEIADQLNRAKELLDAGKTDTGFILLWVSVEALLRHIAVHEGLPLERVPSQSLVKELFAQGALSRAQLDLIQRALSVRNSVVHGFAALEIGDISKELAEFAQQLIAELNSAA